MRFKKTLLAIGAIGFGLLVFVAFNSKKSPPVMPARTVHLAVASESEAAFVAAVRTYATVKQMGFVDRPDSPGAIVILLQAKDEHINVTRYDAKMPVSAGFYRTGGWLGTSEKQLNKDADDFIAAVTETPGVAVVK